MSRKRKLGRDDIMDKFKIGTAVKALWPGSRNVYDAEIIGHDRQKQRVIVRYEDGIERALNPYHVYFHIPDNCGTVIAAGYQSDDNKEARQKAITDIKSLSGAQLRQLIQLLGEDNEEIDLDFGTMDTEKFSKIKKFLSETLADGKKNYKDSAEINCSILKYAEEVLTEEKLLSTDLFKVINCRNASSALVTWDWEDADIETAVICEHTEQSFYNNSTRKASEANSCSESIFNGQHTQGDIPSALEGDSEYAEQSPIDDSDVDESFEPSPQELIAVEDSSSDDGDKQNIVEVKNGTSHVVSKPKLVNEKEDLPNQDKLVLPPMLGVTVPHHQASGKRNYTHPQACLFCKKIISSKMRRHYLSVHTDRSLVQKIISEKEKHQKDMKINHLINKGNFQHNAEVIEQGKGELIVARRPTCYTPAHKFIPCTLCLGFYHKAYLSKHFRACKWNVEKKGSSSSVADGTMLLMPYVRQSESQLRSLILNGMRETQKHEGVLPVIEGDPLIKIFGENQLLRMGGANLRHAEVNNIRNKLRSLARLLIVLREGTNATMNFEHLLKPKYYDMFREAVSRLSVESPQLGLTLGHYIKQINLLNMAEAIKLSNSSRLECSEKFKRLLEANWTATVSASAAKVQRLRKLNTEATLPSTKDLVKLTNHIKSKVPELTKNRDVPNLKKYVLCGLILFNKRRPMEVAELTVADYNIAMAKQDDVIDECMESLSQSEKLIAKRMSVVEVRGKSTRGIRKVFILIDEIMKAALDFLVQENDSNFYIFQRSSSSRPYDGTQIMREVVLECQGLEHPDRIHARTLRKYLATTCQLLDLQTNELSILADHMGHNLNIHTSHYRLQSNVLERGKVAKLLLAVEKGLISKYDEERELEEIATEQIELDLDADLSDDENDETAVIGAALSKSNAKNVQAPKKRWSEEEKEAFGRIFNGEMPRGALMESLSKALPNRTKAQIRTRAHNMITGKLKT